MKGLGSIPGRKQETKKIYLNLFTLTSHPKLYRRAPSVINSYPPTWVLQIKRNLPGSPECVRFYLRGGTLK